MKPRGIIGVGRARAMRGISLAACLLGTVAAAQAESKRLPHQSPHQTLGTVNCATSMCHGSVAPWENGNILRNEYTTWLRQDKHTNAYAILENAASRRIVRNLGLQGPATAQKICLDCHAHNPPPALRDERFVLSEGVGCEGCHGPAEKWIGPHTEDDTSTARNHTLGMYPTSDPVAQARLCLSCHFGDASRLATHRVMGAGHPRLAFEIQTFATLQPAHYVVDEDYVARKGEYDPVRLWAIGQALAAQTRLATLTDPAHAQQGLFPELAAFDCHACHRPMSAGRWVPRLGIGPGRVRLDDSHLLMLRAIVQAIDPEHSASFDAEVSAVHRAVAGEDDADAPPPLTRITALSRTIDGYLPRLKAQRFTPALQRRVLRELVDQAERSSYADYGGAEQAYMAITTLANALVENGVLPASGTLIAALDGLLAHLSDADTFQPAAFQHELAKLRDLLDGQGKS